MFCFGGLLIGELWVLVLCTWYCGLVGVGCFVVGLVLVVWVGGVLFSLVDNVGSRLRLLVFAC